MKTTHIDLITTAGGKIYEVGGVVRDQLLGQTNHKDHDYVVTGLPLETLKQLLAKVGDIDIVGQSFGIIKFRPFGQEQTDDIALPRTEMSTGIGHKDFAVAFDHNIPIETDLGRRDFTINAIAIQLPERILIDPFNGQKDLQDRLLKIVFANAFVDDPLRMVRAVQFAARFRLSLEPQTATSIREHAEKIESVAGERIYEEMLKVLMLAEHPSIAFRLMRDTGLLVHLFPELHTCIGVTQPHKYHIADVFDHIMCAVDSVPSTKLSVRFAALFHDIAKPQTRSEVDGVIHFYNHEHEASPIIDQIMGRLHAPNLLIEKVKRLVENHMFDASFDISRRAIRRLIKSVGSDLIHDLVDLRIGDRIASGKAKLPMGKIGKLRELIEEELAEPAFSIKNLKVNGNDLMALGIPQGPEIGRALNNLLEAVIEDPSLNNKETLLQLIRAEK